MLSHKPIQVVGTQNLHYAFTGSHCRHFVAPSKPLVVSYENTLERQKSWNQIRAKRHETAYKKGQLIEKRTYKREKLQKQYRIQYVA